MTKPHFFMQRKRFYYLIELQYLGFRYHGWQEQPNVLTVERMVKRTLKFILEERRFKVIAAGRTDAKVSVNQTHIELFVEENPLETASFFELLNENLPQDIRALNISETNASFNIIQHPKMKEYVYLFTFGEKPHPFCAAFMTYVPGDLDIEIMKKGANMFEGKHDFRSYCFRPTEKTRTNGEIELCELGVNTMYTASFFPKKTYMLRVQGKGFKRHQIRLMMGALLDLGKGKIALSFLEQTLRPENGIVLEHIAKASGLILNKVSLD